MCVCYYCLFGAPKEQARALEALSKETRATQSGRKNQDTTIENLVCQYVALAFAWLPPTAN